MTRGRKLGLGIAILFGVGLSLLYSVRINDLNNITDQNKATLALAVRALCNQRHDAEAQARESRSFLKTHPHGIDGFTPDLIRKGIADEQTKIAALSDVTCPKPGRKGSR